MGGMKGIEEVINKEELLDLQESIICEIKGGKINLRKVKQQDYYIFSNRFQLRTQCSLSNCRLVV